MVTSQKIYENIMDNRGSKSNLLPLPFSKKNIQSGMGYNLKFVKEQRADGSWLLKNNLRCALVTFERCSYLKALSSQIIKKN